METIEVKVYQFDELNEEAKEKARAWFREGNQNDSFYAESVIDDAKEIGKLMGIAIDHVYYSGFWSQGDGACFEGSYAYKKGSLKAIKSEAPQDTELHAIAEGLATVQKRNFYGISGRVKHSGHYYHSNSTQIDLVKSDNQGYENDLPSDEDEILSQLLRDFMDWVYKRLEKAWEWENADEQIDETIRANEYGFTEEGERSVIL